MITKTQYAIPLDIIAEAEKNIPSDDFKFCLNVPTGNFFYDPWELKSELKGTVWEKIYNSLPTIKGEARLIKLNGGESYISHADIDDRWHLNISGTKCFLIDLDNLKLHPLVRDGVWHVMDAGQRHTASNFGNRARYQIVIRHLLNKNTLASPMSISLKSKEGVDPDDARFLFDDIISPWLNRANKLGMITNFFYRDTVVSFDISKEFLDEFKELLPSEFEIA